MGTVSETRIVSPMPCESSGSKAARVLRIPSGGIPASVTPRCKGTSGRIGGEAAIHFHHLGRIGIFQRHTITHEAEPIEQRTMLQGDFEHRLEKIVLLSPLPLGEG